MMNCIRNITEALKEDLKEVNPFLKLKASLSPIYTYCLLTKGVLTMERSASNFLLKIVYAIY